MACRNLTKAQTAIDTELSAYKDRISTIKLDLGSQQSVKDCSEKIHKDFSDGINWLVNNAGVYAIGNPERMVTADGLELHFGTNFVGHFSLTLLLLDLLRKGAMYANEDSKILTVGSALYKNAKINPNDLQLKNGYSPDVAYSNSKLCSILFTRQLNSRLEHDRTAEPGAGRIKAYTVCPGVCDTELSRYYTTSCFRKFKHSLFRKFIRTPEQGLVAYLHVLNTKTADLNLSGHYSAGVFTPAPVKDETPELTKLATDNDLAKKIWELTENLSGYKLESDCSLVTAGPKDALMF